MRLKLHAQLSWYMLGLWSIFLMSCILGTLWAVWWDTTPPFTIERVAEVQYDPEERVVAYNWVLHRNRFCDGYEVRTVRGEIGGIVLLPPLIWEDARYTAAERASMLRGEYTDGPITLTIPRALGGLVEIQTHLYFWCNPLQRLWPIEIEAPTISVHVEPPAVVTELLHHSEYRVVRGRVTSHSDPTLTLQ